MKIGVFLGKFSSKYCFSDPFRCDCYSGKYFSIYLQKSVEKSDVVRILHGRKVPKSIIFSTNTHFFIQFYEIERNLTSNIAFKSIKKYPSNEFCNSNAPQMVCFDEEIYIILQT